MAQPRVLPHRPEAEKAVLGGVLLRGRQALLEATDVLGVDDFYLPVGKAIFRGLLEIDRRGDPIDAITLEAELRSTGELELVGGIEGLARLDRYAAAHNIKAHASLVRDASLVRATVLAAREIAEKGMEEVEDALGFVASSRTRLASVGSNERKPYRTAAEVMQTTIPVIVDRKKEGASTVTGVPTGFLDLDGLTDGLQPTDLIILAGRPSMGKTAVALNMATNACVTQQKHRHLPPSEQPRRYPVLMFSLEMSAEQLMERAIAKEARLPHKDIRSTAPFMRDGMQRLIAGAERIAQSPLAINDQASLSIDQIRSGALRWAEDPRLFPPDEDGKKSGLILVDYLQLARGTLGKKYGSREQEISDISRGLKGLAKEIKMPVLALSQLNRAVDSRADHRPQLSDLRESGAIEQDADVIMFVYREERYLAPDAPPDKVTAVEGKSEIIIGKQRNGPLGTVHLHFNKREQRFESVIQEGRYDDL